jgi:hypothetical protein
VEAPAASSGKQTDAEQPKAPSGNLVRVSGHRVCNGGRKTGGRCRSLMGNGAFLTPAGVGEDDDWAGVDEGEEAHADRGRQGSSEVRTPPCGPPPNWVAHSVGEVQMETSRVTPTVHNSLRIDVRISTYTVSQSVCHRGSLRRCGDVGSIFLLTPASC